MLSLLLRTSAALASLALLGTAAYATEYDLVPGGASMSLGFGSYAFGHKTETDGSLDNIYSFSLSSAEAVQIAFSDTGAGLSSGLIQLNGPSGLVYSSSLSSQPTPQFISNLSGVYGPYPGVTLPAGDYTLSVSGTVSGEAPFNYNGAVTVIGSPPESGEKPAAYWLSPDGKTITLPPGTARDEGSAAFGRQVDSNTRIDDIYSFDLPQEVALQISFSDTGAALEAGKAGISGGSITVSGPSGVVQKTAITQGPTPQFINNLTGVFGPGGEVVPAGDYTMVLTGYVYGTPPFEYNGTVTVQAVPEMDYAAAPAAAAPEPATWAMMALGFASLSVLGRLAGKNKADVSRC
jgi:hypothetical protein